MPERTRGVVTGLAGSSFTISCPGGRKFGSDVGVILGDWAPALNDIVEFSPVDGRAVGVTLFFRKDEAPGVDTRIRCPACGELVIPKARVEKGRVVEVLCPKCMSVIEKPENPAGKRRAAVYALAAVAVAALVAAAMFAS